MFVEYEPCNYPGVNIKFFWKKDCIGTNNYGKCVCNPGGERCSGKGDGESECKKITIAVFQSGKVIITGADMVEQIHGAYSWITNVFRRHYESILREDVCIPTTDELIEFVKRRKHNNKLKVPRKHIEELNKALGTNYMEQGNPGSP